MALTMEAVRTSETSVNFNVATRRYITQDSKLQLIFVFETRCIFLDVRTGCLNSSKMGFMFHGVNDTSFVYIQFFTTLERLLANSIS
jgi:hypothetical protein